MSESVKKKNICHKLWCFLNLQQWTRKKIYVSIGLRNISFQFWFFCSLNNDQIVCELKWCWIHHRKLIYGVDWTIAGAPKTSNYVGKRKILIICFFISALSSLKIWTEKWKKLWRVRFRLMVIDRHQNLSKMWNNIFFPSFSLTMSRCLAFNWRFFF